MKFEILHPYGIFITSRKVDECISKTSFTQQIIFHHRVIVVILYFMTRDSCLALDIHCLYKKNSAVLILVHPWISSPCKRKQKSERTYACSMEISTEYANNFYYLYSLTHLSFVTASRQVQSTYPV